MSSLVPLDDCLARALAGVVPVAPERVPLAVATGGVLAEELGFPNDTPPVAEALRSGYAVTALDLTGASAALPIPLVAAVPVLPGDPMPPGTDAVLPSDGVETMPMGVAAIRPIAPGEGIRRSGHDGRAGVALAPRGTVLSDRLCRVAELAGVSDCRLRRARVAVDLPDPTQAGLARALLGLGGDPVAPDAADMVLRPSADHVPRLALAPGDTAWLAREGAVLVLSVPRRFDGLVAACLALGLPALDALTGAIRAPETRVLTRKIASGLGLSDLVLLRRSGEGWGPGPAGSVTLAGLAAADAFAILPPGSEGLPAGAMLEGLPMSISFGLA
jgi:molybdopterin molybdotransferase